MEIHLRYCPSCHEEYQPHMTRCVECGAALKDKLSDELPPREPLPGSGDEAPRLPPGEYKRLVDVAPSAGSDLMAELDAAGIPFQVGPALHGVRLSVRDEDRALALRIVESEGALPQQPDPAERAVATEGGPCPACGTPITPGVTECPECGLAFSGDEGGCEECGSPLRDGDDVCPACGHRQTGS